MYYAIIILIIKVAVIYLLKEKIKFYVNATIRYAVQEIESKLSQKLKEELASITIIRGNYDKDLRQHLEHEVWVLNDTLSGNFHKIAKNLVEEKLNIYGVTEMERK